MLSQTISAPKLSTGHIISSLFLSLSLLLALFPPDVLSSTQAYTAALVVSALTLWATGVVSEHLTSLLFFTLAMLLSLAPADIVFSGFNSTAIWMIFSGFVIGMAFKTTGLGQRLAGYLQVFSGSYARLIWGVVICTTALGFLMPSSMGRLVLMMPIVVSLAELNGFRPGSQGYIGMTLAAAFGCHVTTFSVLPANIPNMVLSGATETIHGINFGYAEYLLLHFPLLGLAKAAIIALLIIRFFSDRPQLQRSNPSQPWQTNERGLLILLLAALALWVSDQWHGIGAAWVALTAATLLLLPKIGLVSEQQFRSEMNFNTLLFIAGILGIGALINASGLGQVLAQQLSQHLPLDPEQPFINFISLSATSLLTGLFTGLPGIPAVLTPMAEQFAEGSGFTIKTVLMTQLIGIANFLLPYQSGPMLVALKLADTPMAPAIKLCLWVSLLSLLLTPLNYLWWQLLGWF